MAKDSLKKMEEEIKRSDSSEPSDPDQHEPEFGILFQELDLPYEEAIERDLLRQQISELADKDMESSELDGKLLEYLEKYGEDLFMIDFEFQLLEMQGQTDQMEALISMIPPSAFDPLIYYAYLARVDFAKGDFKDALEKLNRLPELPDDPAALYYLQLKALAAGACGDYKLAADCMEDMLLEEQTPESLILAGAFYWMIGKTDRAQEYLPKGFREFDDELIDWASYSFDKLNLNKVLDSGLIPVQAVRAIEEQRLGTENPFDLINNLEFGDDAVDYQKVLDSVQEILNEDPSNPLALYSAGYASLMLGMTGQGHKLLGRVVDLPAGQLGLDDNSLYNVVILKIRALEILYPDDEDEEDAVLVNRILKKITRDIGRESSASVPLVAFAYHRNDTGYLHYYFRDRKRYLPEEDSGENALFDAALALHHFDRGNLKLALKYCRKAAGKDVPSQFYFWYADILQNLSEKPWEAVLEESGIPPFFQIVIRVSLFAVARKYEEAREEFRRVWNILTDDEDREMLKNYEKTLRLSEYGKNIFPDLQSSDSDESDENGFRFDPSEDDSEILSELAGADPSFDLIREIVEKVRSGEYSENNYPLLKSLIESWVTDLMESDPEISSDSEDKEAKRESEDRRNHNG